LIGAMGADRAVDLMPVRDAVSGVFPRAEKTADDASPPAKNA